MKKLYTTLLLLACFFIHENVKAQLANINYESRIDWVWSSEDNGSSDCSEWGTEEYTTKAWFRDNTSTTWWGYICMTCDNNGDCTYGHNTWMGSRSNVYTYKIDPIFESYEDDGGDRCDYNSGDDCHQGPDDVADVYLRRAYPSSYDNGYTSYGTWATSETKHQRRMKFAWRYSGTTNQITPGCNSQSTAYSSGYIRSWTVNLSTANTYRFSTVGGTSEDTYIRIYAADGYTIVAQNDDNGPGGPGTQASVDFNPSSNGYYYVEVSHYSRSVLTSGGTMYYQIVGPYGGTAVLGTPSTTTVNFCNSGGNYGTAVSLLGYANGLPQWEWGSNNGAWNSWVTGPNAGNCCFPKKTSNNDGNADRIRVKVVGCTTTGYSSNIYIRNEWNEAPSSLSRSTNNVCPGTTVTLTANFPTATNMNGNVQFFSGSCGGTLVATVAGNGTTTVATNISAPSSTTTYYARYTGAYSGCNTSACVSTTLTINFGAPTAISATWGDCAVYKARWNAVAGASSYRIDISTNSSFTNIIESNISVTGTSYDLDYPPGTVLYYRVRAVNACYTSPNSNWIGVTIPSPSGNDYYKYATDITSTIVGGGTYNGSFNNDSYGTESGEPTPEDIYATAWYKFTTPSSGFGYVSAWINSTGNSDNTAVAIYRRNSSLCPFGNLTKLGSDWDCAGDNSLSVSTTCLDPNTTYYIQYGTTDCTLDGGDKGNFNVSVSSLLSAPDNICNALRVGSSDIGVNQSATTGTYSNSCSSVNTGHTDPSNAEGNDATDWYYFTTPGTVPSQYYFRFWNIGDFGTWGGMEGEVYKQTGGTCPPTLQYIGSWDPGACGVEEESGGFCLDPNSTYYIMADAEEDGACGGRGRYQLRVRGNGDVKAPDNICDAVRVGTGDIGINQSATTAEYVNDCSTVNTGGHSDPVNDQSNNATDWYYFTTPVNAAAKYYFQFSNIDFGADEGMEGEVYKKVGGTCPPTLQYVGSWDPAGCGVVAESDGFCLEPSSTYYIMADEEYDGICDGRGKYQLTVRGNNASNAPDLCGDVTGTYDLGTLTVGNTIGDATGANRWNNFCATTAGDPDPNWTLAGIGTDPYQTVWLKFNSGAAGRHVTLEGYNDPGSHGDQIDLKLALYEGPCNALSLVDKDYDTPPYSETMEGNYCLTPGTDHYVLVSGSNFEFATGSSKEGFFGLTVKDNGPYPPNDLICGTVPNATAVLNTWSPVNVFTNNENGTDCGDPDPTCYTNDQGVWISTTAPGGNLWIDANNDSGDDINYQIAVYSSSDNTCSGVLTEVACDADNVLWEEDMAIRCLDPTKTYWILVDGLDLPAFDDEEGNIDIDFYYPREGGDLVCNHVPINGTGTDIVPMNGSIELVNNSNFCATAAGDPDPVSWDPDHTVWYSFIAPTYAPEPTRKTSVIIEATNVSAFNFITEPDLTDAIDIQLALYDLVGGTVCSSPMLMPWVDEYDPGGICPDDTNPLCDEDMIATCLTPGRRYYLMVDGSGANTQGLFDLKVTDYQELDAPNDLACNATDFGTAAHGTWNLVNREVTIERLDETNYCADNVNEPLPTNWTTNITSVWYTFTAPPSGMVHISSENSALPGFSDQIDIAVAVYEELPDCNNPDVGEVEVGSDYQVGGLCDGEDLTVECLVPGEIYYLMLTGNTELVCPDGDYGEYNISITSDPRDPVGTNDNVCNAIPLGTVPSDLGATMLKPTIAGGFGTGTGNIPFSSGWDNNDYPFNNFCAGNGGDPDPDDFDTDQTVWFTFIAPSTGSIEIDAISGPVSIIDPYKDAIDLQIAVYESSDNTCSGNFYEIKSEYDFGFLDETVEVHCLDAGRIYYLMVDGSGANTQGYFGLELIEIEPDPQPGNDYICDAEDLGNSFFTGSPVSTGTSPADFNICATIRVSDVNNNSEPDPTDFDLDRTVWYSFTTPTTGVPATGSWAVQIDVDGALGVPFFGGDWMDPQIAVWEQTTGTASCDETSLSEITSEYDGALPFLETAEAYCLKPGYTYYIQIDGSGLNKQGYFELTISNYAPIIIPTNDDVANSEPIGNVSSTVSGIIGSDGVGSEYHNYCTGVETGEVALDPWTLYTPDNTVWFDFSMPAGGAYAGNYIDGTVILKSDPNDDYDGINLLGAVYESSDNTADLTKFTLNNSEGDIALWDEDVAFECMEPGQTYYLQVDGYAGPLDLFRAWGEGYFTVQVRTDEIYKNWGNDDRCATAVALGAVPNGGSIPRGANVYHNRCATVEAGEVADLDHWTLTDPDNSVWFSFVAPTSGNITIDIDGTGGDAINLVAALYEAPGGCSNQLVFIESGETQPLYDEDITVTCLTGGNTYYLQVDGMGLFGEDIGTFNIEIRDDGGTTTRPYNNDFCDVFDGTAAAADFGDVTDANILKAAESNFCANIESGEPMAGAQRTVWYKFTAPASGRVNITVSDADGLFGLEPEAWLYEYAGAACSGGIIPGTFTELDYSYDPFGDENIDYECLVPGGTYYVRVDGLDILGFGTQGLFDIRIQDMIPNYAVTEQPGNDECNLSGAYELTVQDEACFLRSGQWNVDNPGFASYNYGKPTISSNAANTCGTNCGDIWYHFVMPSTGIAYVEGYDDIILDMSEMVIQAYSGTCGSLTPLVCANDDAFIGTVAFEVVGNPGDDIYLQIFDEDGDQYSEDFDLCVSKRCGADLCSNMLLLPPMELDVEYCWDVETATGESVATDGGYQECGLNNDPDNSVYFSFTTDDYLDYCAEYTITMTLPDLGGLGTCPVATNGITLSIFEDPTPCDGNPLTQLDCQEFNDCDPENGFFWTKTYETSILGGGNNIKPGTTYYIQIDGWGQLAPGEIEDGTIMISRSCQGRQWDYVSTLGTTVSDGYCEDVDGWRNYYDDNGTTIATGNTYPEYPRYWEDDIFIFSVHPMGNSNFDGTASITLLNNFTSANQLTYPIAHKFTMRRYWNFELAPGSSIDADKPVAVRFYYLESEKDEIIQFAKATILMHENNTPAVLGLKLEPFEWFKTDDGVNFHPSFVTPYIIENTREGISESAQFSSRQFAAPPDGLVGGSSLTTYPEEEDFRGNGQDHDDDPMNEWCNGIEYVELYGINSFSGGTGAVGISFRDNSPLPVELVSFVGWNEDEVNQLEWVTASEVNNELFVVERSVDGLDFVEIGSVPGSGTTSEEHIYNLTDGTPVLGVNYYRLKQIDIDGTFTYSSVIAVEVRGSDLRNAIVKLHPNPTRDIINLQLQAADQTEFELQIWDINGRILHSDVLSARIGLNLPISLDVEDYAQGVYIIKVEDRATGEVMEAKFIKQ